MLLLLWGETRANMLWGGKCCSVALGRQMLLGGGNVARGREVAMLWGGKCCSVALGRQMLLGGEKLLCSGEVNVALLLWGGKCCLGERSCYALEKNAC